MSGGDEVSEDPEYPVPYDFCPNILGVLDQDAFTVVRDTLRALPLPYRLDVDAVLYTSPQAMVRATLGAK